jgi:hypothetical protein
VIAAAACNDGSASMAQTGLTDGSPLTDVGAASKPLWNGLDLSGWSGDPTIWHVAGDAIEGYSPTGVVKDQSFLIYTAGAFANFLLTADLYIEGDGNSGIQYRSTIVDPVKWIVSGYQADAGQTFWGDLYEDGGRATLLHGSVPCKKTVSTTGFNAFEITASGPTLTHRLNGVDCLKFTETATGKPTKGVIAFQYHVPGGYHVRIRNLRVREL